MLIYTFGMIVLFEISKQTYGLEFATDNTGEVIPQNIPWDVENETVNGRAHVRVMHLNCSSNALHEVVVTSRLYRRIGFRSRGCTCQDLTCGCCFGMNITQFNYDREGCMNLTYDPLEFAIGMTMLWNDQPIFSNSISGKNPPPICVPVPVPYIPNVDFCMRLFDIFTPGRNLHVCMDVEARIQRAPVLVLHFECMKMGNDGVALVKPTQPTVRLRPVANSTNTTLN